MLRFKTDFMRHSYSLREALAKKGGTASIDFDSMAVRAEIGNKEIALRPKFVVKQPDGKVHYAEQLNNHIVGFFGWLPYLYRVWPIGQDKLAFKEYAVAQGLRTPKWEFFAERVDFTCIVKATLSSFGYGIRGPYSPQELDNAAGQLQQGEYYEELILGKIAKAWYWDATLAAIELFDMPRIKGDGRHTFLELVRHAIGKDVSMPSKLDRIAKIQGFSSDDVLPKDKEVVADYRYVSPLNPTVYGNFNVLMTIKGTEVCTQLEQIGKALHAGIPEEIRANTAFSVDAIVDSSNKVWLLEMNCNPQLHPDIYEAMLDGILA